MKIYISSKITGDKDYKEKFTKMEAFLKKQGCTVLNPAILPEGFEYNEYMHICYAMIDVCDAILLFGDWENSKGANFEREYARMKGKQVLYYEKRKDVVK